MDQESHKQNISCMAQAKGFQPFRERGIAQDTLCKGCLKPHNPQHRVLQISIQDSPVQTLSSNSCIGILPCFVFEGEVFFFQFSSFCFFILSCVCVLLYYTASQIPNLKSTLHELLNTILPFQKQKEHVLRVFLHRVLHILSIYTALKSISLNS